MQQRRRRWTRPEANLAQAELNLSYTEIRAPQDGTITSATSTSAPTPRSASRCSTW